MDLLTVGSPTTSAQSSETVASTPGCPWCPSPEPLDSRVAEDSLPALSPAALLWGRQRSQPRPLPLQGIAGG